MFYSHQTLPGHHQRSGLPTRFDGLHSRFVDETNRMMRRLAITGGGIGNFQRTITVLPAIHALRDQRRASIFLIRDPQGIASTVATRRQGPDTNGLAASVLDAAVCSPAIGEHRAIRLLHRKPRRTIARRPLRSDAQEAFGFGLVHRARCALHTSDAPQAQTI